MAEGHSMLAGFGVLPSVSSLTAGAALDSTGIAPAPGWQQALTVPSQVQLRKELYTGIIAPCEGFGRLWQLAPARMMQTSK